MIKGGSCPVDPPSPTPTPTPPTPSGGGSGSKNLTWLYIVGPIIIVGTIIMVIFFLRRKRVKAANLKEEERK